MGAAAADPGIFQVVPVQAGERLAEDHALGRKLEQLRQFRPCHVLRPAFHTPSRSQFQRSTTAPGRDIARKCGAGLDHEVLRRQ